MSKFFRLIPSGCGAAGFRSRWRHIFPPSKALLVPLPGPGIENIRENACLANHILRLDGVLKRIEFSVRSQSILS